jgi:hypothetical protein
MHLDNLRANDVVAAAVADIIAVVMKVTAAAVATIMADVVATAATVRHRRRPREVRLRARIGGVLIMATRWRGTTPRGLC